MPWSLHFRTLDDRINTRADIQALRQDEYVREVRVTPHRTLGTTVHVEFHEGRDAPMDSALGARLRPYRLVRGRRNTGMAENFLRLYGPDEVRQRLDQPSIDQETRQRIIEQYLSSSSGRSQLAQAMIQPLRQRLDYQAIGRRTFLVEQMPEGALPVYTPEIHTPGHDTDYLALPGHLPLHSTKHYTDAELPSWVAVGSWVREQKPEGRIGMVVNHYRTEDRQRRAHVHILLGIWRTQDSVDLCAHHVIVGWESCRQPPEPLTVWERILRDVDFVDG